ncbi:hypothetical protein GQ42DRAFT_164688 [Ramicandelaber brevisporus]|nr:hypothetical protein GQ42DRAFT_164688 [Ramicandelaber brevisporus]
MFLTIVVLLALWSVLPAIFVRMFFGGIFIICILLVHTNNFRRPARHRHPHGDSHYYWDGYNWVHNDSHHGRNNHHHHHHHNRHDRHHHHHSGDVYEGETEIAWDVLIATINQLEQYMVSHSGAFLYSLGVGMWHGLRGIPAAIGRGLSVAWNGIVYAFSCCFGCCRRCPRLKVEWPKRNIKDHPPHPPHHQHYYHHHPQHHHHHHSGENGHANGITTNFDHHSNGHAVGGWARGPPTPEPSPKQTFGGYNGMYELPPPSPTDPYPTPPTFYDDHPPSDNGHAGWPSNF